MIKVGITGGIGSGKSIICEVFSKLGAPVYSADDAARTLVDTDPDIRESLVMLMGEEVYTGNLLNRPMMADMIFSNKLLLEKVNQIIHPRVAEQFRLWCLEKSNFPYLIQESALLFESGTYHLFDQCITVAAPEELRIQRVIARRNMTLDKVRSILLNQLPEEEKIARSHHVIINDGRTPVIPQVLRLHALFKKPFDNSLSS
jgi:dephospho-CoA kinase